MPIDKRAYASAFHFFLQNNPIDEVTTSHEAGALAVARLVDSPMLLDAWELFLKAFRESLGEALQSRPPLSPQRLDDAAASGVSALNSDELIALLLNPSQLCQLAAPVPALTFERVGRLAADGGSTLGVVDVEDTRSIELSVFAGQASRSSVIEVRCFNGELQLRLKAGEPLLVVAVDRDLVLLDEGQSWVTVPFRDGETYEHVLARAIRRQ